MTDASEVFDAIYGAKDNNRYVAYAIFLLLAEIFSFAIAAIIALIVAGLLFAAALPTLLSSTDTSDTFAAVALLLVALLPICIFVFLPLLVILCLITVVPLTYSLYQEALAAAGFKRRLPESYFPFGQMISICKLCLLNFFSYFFTWLDRRVFAIQLITYTEIILLLISYFLNIQFLLLPLLAVFLITLIPFVMAEFYAFTRLTFVPATYLTEPDSSEINAISKSWEFTKGRVWELALLNGGVLGGLLTFLQLVLRMFQNIPCVSYIFILIFIIVSPVISAVGYTSIYKIMKKG